MFIFKGGPLYLSHGQHKSSCGAQVKVWVWFCQTQVSPKVPANLKGCIKQPGHYSQGNLCMILFHLRKRKTLTIPHLGLQQETICTPCTMVNNGSKERAKRHCRISHQATTGPLGTQWECVKGLVPLGQRQLRQSKEEIKSHPPDFKLFPNGMTWSI